MNYLKLKQKIYEAIERNPLDRSAYEEMFAVCREYEKIDFQTAHAWNHELRNRISWGLRMTVCSQKFDEAREFDDLMFRSLLFGAQHFFDDYLQAVEYGKPLDKKFYQPRRHYLRRYVDAYQEILDGKLDFLSISMPKRAGKSQLGINFTNMLSGKYPDRATLMEGTGDDLVKSFYLGCLEYLTLPSDYHFYDIFPESKLVQTNADTKIINLLHKSRFPTVMCRSIDARQVGLSEATNLLYLDDCVEGREEAKNRQRLAQYVGIKEGSAEHKAILKVFNDSGLCTRYKMTVNDAWCATSTSAAFIATGLSNIFPCVECSCENMINLAKKAGIWVENDAYIPSTGDVILYDWDDNGVGDCTGWSDHVGIVVSVSGSTIKIIEGNKNDSVGYRNIAVNGKYIRGFITPKFSSGTSTVTPSTKKSVDEVAKEVLAGAWGNGDARKNALTAAGYNYSEVQAAVNRLAGGKTTTPTKSITEVAKEVLAGKWGNGDNRKKKLEAAGYNYSQVQAKVNELAKGSTSSKKSVTQIAKEVIAGKWGNGTDRKNKLTAAGYDYTAVQREVNRLL